LRYLWAIFWRLRRRIRPGMEGPSPITFPDVQAFKDATHERLSPWEVGLIERLDDLYLNACGEAAKQARNPSTQEATEPDAWRKITQDVPRRTVKRGKL